MWVIKCYLLSPVVPDLDTLNKKSLSNKFNNPLVFVWRLCPQVEEESNIQANI